MVLEVLSVILLVVTASAKPASIEDNGREPLISFKDGTIGVNFLGFKAAAGLGGLLTGNAAHGGLHASASTPFGQAAGAGLGGATDNNGRSFGGLFAGATAGGGVGASAGLAGDTSASGSYGKSFAGASNGGFAKEIVKTTVNEVEQPKTTYVERTVVPNYVEKTIKVPTYVEKKIKVPAPPTIVEKIVVAPEVHARSNYDDVEKVKVVTKTGIHPHPHHLKHVTWYDAGGAASGQVNGAGSFRTTVGKNPQFFNDIFNIPISTLQAVNRLVSGIAGHGGGSVAVSKSFSAST